MMCRCWLLQGVGDEYTIDEPIPEELLTEDLPDAVVASDDESSANDEEQSPAREEKQSPSIKEKQSPASEEKHPQDNHFNEDELRQRK